MKTLFSAVVLALLLLNAPVVDACSCAGSPGVCESYRNADAVFIGVVQNVLTNKVKGEDGREYRAGQVANVQVEKSFKGTAQPEVVFRTEGTSCDTVYEEGERRLFYAYYNKETKTWSTAACDRSGRMDSAADDLLYLQGLPKSASTTRLSGQIVHFDDDPEKGFTRVKNLIGAKVKIAGEGIVYEAYTDKNGVYELYGLPPGKYTVEPEIPVGLKLRFPMHYGAVDLSDRINRKVLLKEKSCGGVTFVLSSKNRIAGKLFGADSAALPNVCLHLMPKGKSVARRLFDCTDAQGSYELTEIPPGEYLIVVNSEGKISSNAPFPTAYFPGVFDKDKATVLTIAQGTNLEDYDIHIPSQQNRRTLQGVVQYSDGKPAARKFVDFTADHVKEGFDGKVHTSTDDQGRFTLNVLEGLIGTLRGSMFAYEGEYVDCPQLDRILRAQAGKMADVATKPMTLEITRDMPDIKLTFPFPYCKKANEEK